MSRKILPEEIKVEIDHSVVNESFLPHLDSIHDYEVYYGGSGSGKSYFVAFKLLIRMTLMRGRNMVCLRKQKTDCIQSVFPLMKNMVKKLRIGFLWEVRNHPKPMLVNKANGNQILFEGYDDPEDIKSIQFEGDADGYGWNLTDVWYEEVNAQPDRESLLEIERRLRDPKVRCSIIYSFNPVSRMHWLFDFVEVELRDGHGGELETVIVEKWLNGIKFSYLLHHSTYKDNRFLPAHYGAMLEANRFKRPYDYMVYTLGGWGVTGQSVFDVESVHRRMKEVDGVSYRFGMFGYEEEKNIDGSGGRGLPVADSFVFRDGFPDTVDSKRGGVRIYKEPLDRYPYVMSIDTAGEGSDYWGVHVFNNITDEQCAVFHFNGDVAECVRQVYGLGRYYNFALAVPEVNFDTWVVEFLRLMKYPNIYRRMTPDDKSWIRKEDKLGWRTQVNNRQAMLSELVDWIGFNIDRINDYASLSEMLTFTRQSIRLKGIWWGAEPGAHDDLIMSMAIFLQGREQQAMHLIEASERIEGFWLESELEDAVSEGRYTKRQVNKYLQGR